MKPKNDLPVALIAERDALAKDAARYRWLRDSSSDEARVMSYHETLGEWLLYAAPEDIDAAIDAAMKGTPT